LDSKNVRSIVETFGFHPDLSARAPIRIAIATKVLTPNFLPISASMLTEELRYKLEEYRKDKVKEGMLL
jgi:hypothetical protein